MFEEARGVVGDISFNQVELLTGEQLHSVRQSPFKGVGKPLTLERVWSLSELPRLEYVLVLGLTHGTVDTRKTLGNWKLVCGYGEKISHPVTRRAEKLVPSFLLD